MKTPRPQQYSLSLKVDAERKAAFAKRCADAGMSQTEMLDRLLLDRLPDETPLPSVLRDHLALVHHLRAALAAGSPVDRAALDTVLDATHTLISAVRQSMT